MPEKKKKLLKITLVRSKIGSSLRIKRTLYALGLKKTGSTRIHTDTPEIRGMLNKVKHLVEVKDVESNKSKTK